MSTFDELCQVLDSKGIDSREIDREFMNELTVAAHAIGCSIEEMARYFLLSRHLGQDRPRRIQQEVPS